MRFLLVCNILEFFYFSNLNINNKLLINFFKNLKLLKILIEILSNLFIFF